MSRAQRRRYFPFFAGGRTGGAALAAAAACLLFLSAVSCFFARWSAFGDLSPMGTSFELGAATATPPSLDRTTIRVTEVDQTPLCSAASSSGRARIRSATSGLQ